MKPRNPDERFEWDLTAVILLALAVLFVVAVVFAVLPLGHVN